MSDVLSDLSESELEEINELYPEGTIEREALKYSMGKPQYDEVPPMLRAAFKVLLGVSVLMATSSIISYVNS